MIFDHFPSKEHTLWSRYNLLSPSIAILSHHELTVGLAGKSLTVNLIIFEVINSSHERHLPWVLNILPFFQCQIKSYGRIHPLGENPLNIYIHACARTRTQG